MKRFCALLALIVVGVFLFPYRSPAPLVYRPGEGWSYELPGEKGGDWRKMRAKDQLQVAQDAFDKKNYKLALKAAERVVKLWPLSDYPAQAQYLIGLCYEAKKMDEKAFNAYQTMLTKYPKAANSDEVQRRQFTIAVRYLHGQWFKLFGYIPFFPSMDKTADMFDDIVRYGPYGELAPQAQMNIGAAREKQKDYPLAVIAYATAADRYSDQPSVAADAQFKEAMSYTKQARKADYDQSIAGQAISTFTDFMALYPDDPRVPESQKVITSLKTVEATGNFRIAEYYEKQKKMDGALIYYNEVLLSDASSPLAAQARQRIDRLKRRMPVTPEAPATTNAPAASATSTNAPQ
jgi:outer membrane protein assembly factor BamD